MTRDKEWEDLVRRARELPPMTDAQKREQRASFAYGQMALMSKYANATPEELAALKALCRKMAGCEPDERGTGE